MNLSPEILWQRLARSRSAVQAAQVRAEEQNGSTQAPFGFATRVVARWQALNREERFQFWRKWSIKAVFAALIACGLVVALQRPQHAVAGQPAAEPLQVPSISIPLP